MSQALSQVIIPTESHGSDSSEEHLDPARHRHRLSNHSVRNHNNPADPAMNSLGKVQLEIDAEDDLHHHHEHQCVRKGRVDVLRELAAFVSMSEEVCEHSDNRSDNLERDVPARAYNL